MTTKAFGIRPAMISLFLFSSAVLAFEIALTRVFSVMLSYHYVFAIVSIALLGLGLGGLLFQRWGTQRARAAIQTFATAFPLLMAGVLVAILSIPVGSGILADFAFWVYLLFAIIPFCAAGLAISGLFQLLPQKSSWLYGADLLGAALAALLVVPAMDAVGAVNVIFLAAALGALGSVVLALPGLRRSLIGGTAVLLMVGAFVGLVLTKTSITVPIAKDPAKDMSQMLANPAFQAKIVESRWSSFGRTDLVKSELLPNEMTIFVDGAAGSSMYNIKAILADKDETAHLTLHFGEFFPFFLLKQEERRTALTIGPGGGRDVVVALLGGVKSIKAVEVNPDVVQIVKDYAKFNGGLYTDIPEVTPIVAEGRNYVKTSKELFDLIMLSIPVTKSTRSVEGYALTENNLFTVEAFGDYLNRLSTNGRMIIVAHNEAEIYKLVSLTVKAFENRGVSQQEAMKHLYTIASGMMPTIVIQNQPLTPDQATQVHELSHKMGFDQGAFYIPYIDQTAVNPQERLGVDKELRMFDRALVAVAQGKVPMETLAKNASLNIEAPTDDRPFFFQFERSLPSPFGVFLVLIIALVGGVATLCLLPRKPLAVPSTFLEAVRADRRLKAGVVLFFALGVGYMMIEIAFFQRLIVFFGQPQKALSVLLVSLLLGNGVGSLLSAGGTPRTVRWKAATAALGVAFLVVPAMWLFPVAVAAGMDAQWGAVGFLVPLGVLMGMPLPLAIRSLDTQGRGGYVAALWGVNGVASVAGSALAMIVGISVGFVWAVGLGALLYAAASILSIGLKKNSKEELSW